MLHVLICEDDMEQRARIEGIVNRHILSDDFNIDLVLSADKPSDLLDHVEAQKIQSGLYFLDVDLQSEINGIELAAKIRKMDVSATIVFITSQAKLAHLVFRYKVEAMDYIVKGSPPEEIEKRVAECIEVAYSHYLDGKRGQSKYFTVKIGDQVLNIPYREILYFESSIELKNRVLLHKKNGALEFRGYINKAAALGLPFFRCHQSFVLNVEHIAQVNMSSREAEMADGAMIPIARRKLTELLRLLG